ncbi:hypothetical protein NC651_017468 [Populus alba x Populus x berolinensis]|nr:hypothetical protein NC651_017468 [Populus alba x Populus x berolinensis]
MASKRLTKSALTTIKSTSKLSRLSHSPHSSLSRTRAISSSSSSLLGTAFSRPLNDNKNVVFANFSMITSTRFFHSSSPRFSSATASSSQVDPSQFTEMAWEGVVGAVETAQANKQQVVETEHLMKSLLEQKDGLARRIFAKIGVDNSSALQITIDFISQQPKVTGGTSGPVMGSNLSSLLDNARKNKKDMGDDFVSVEHIVLAFHLDKRFGQQFLRNLGVSEKDLRDAVTAVRGNQRVTDQNPEGKYQALDKYGSDLTELARRGKLDPVIGRDDEIRRCIQILSRRTKNNPVIIGEPGVGKTAIAEG